MDAYENKAQQLARVGSPFARSYQNGYNYLASLYPTVAKQRAAAKLKAAAAPQAAQAEAKKGPAALVRKCCSFLLSFPFFNLYVL